MKLSNLIGANVLSIFEGKKVGYVVDVDIDYKTKKISSLRIANDSDEQDYCLDRKNVYAFADGVVLVKNVQAIMLGYQSVGGSLLGKLCVKANGENLCILDDVVLDKNLYLKSLELNRTDIPVSEILSVGENAVILKASSGQSRARFKAVGNDEKFALNVSLLKMAEAETIATTPISVADEKIETADGEVRIAETTIIGKSGEIIVRKGQIVTNSILEKLKAQNLQSFLRI